MAATIQRLSHLYISRNQTSPIIEVAHYNHESSALHCYQSVVVSANSDGILSAWDLRSQKEAWHTQISCLFGSISSFLVDPNHNWMVISTSRGIYTCLDARFNVPVRSWAHPAPPPHNRIHRLFPNTLTDDSQSLFMAAVGCNELWMWDIETLKTIHLFRMLPCTYTPLPSLSGIPINCARINSASPYSEPTFSHGVVVHISIHFFFMFLFVYDFVFHTETS